MTKEASKKVISLASVLSKAPIYSRFKLWIVGDTPLIVHAWSEKARREMLIKQVGATKPGKEPRDPQADFLTSLYDMGNGCYGFPATGIKNAVLSSAHKDKNVPRVQAMQALYLDADMVRTRPALAGAVCDMPLIRIFGTEPECREDMVKIGAGLQKTANLSYRGQFSVWAMRVTGELNTSVLSAEKLAFLFCEAGRASGLGEWRNERRGMFGAFHIASPEEEEAWEKFASGKSKTVPVPARFAEAAE